MKQKFREQLKSLRARIDRRAAQVSTGAGLAFVSAASFAQTTTSLDMTDVLAKIAEGLAAAVLVGTAFTGARLAVKAYKLPRNA